METGKSQVDRRVRMPRSEEGFVDVDAVATRVLDLDSVVWRSSVEAALLDTVCVNKA